MLRVRKVLSFVGLATLCSPAQAQTVIVIPPTVVRQSAPESEAVWQIAPKDAEQVSSETALKKNTTILRQRLLPKQMAVVEGDVERADGGDRWAAAGDQLFGAKVGDLDALCVIKTKMNVTLRMFLLPSPTQLLKQDCFVDIDGDGNLDQRFEADPGFGVLPNVARAEPRALQPLAPVGFSLRDPAEFSDESWVEIRYRGDGIKPDKPARFQVRYYYDGKTRDLSGEERAKYDGEIQVLEVLGARIALSTNVDGKLVANVEKPMDADFGVSTALVYR